MRGFRLKFTKLDRKDEFSEEDTMKMFQSN